MLPDRPIDVPEQSFASVYDRRRLAAAGEMLPQMWDTLPEWPSVGGGRRVIVLGGGISGLCTAWSLRKAGFDPIILERNDRVGGRFYTLRNHFGDQYAELGVTRIADTHVLTLAYARHFGLEILEYPLDATQLYYVMGHRFLSTSRGKAHYPADFPLSPEERDIDAESLNLQLAAKAFSVIGDPRDTQWPPATVRKDFSGETFFRSLDRTGASHAAREICRAYEGTEIEMFSGLAWSANQRLDAKWFHTYAIAGGNDRLTTAFADDLGDRILKGAHVQRVISREDGVTVEFLRNGDPETIEGDFVVCALPHRILLEVAFDPPLSGPKHRAASEIPMFTVTRLNFQFSHRFWADEGIVGLLAACTTTPIERLWDLTSLQSGTSGILTAYVQDRNAAALDELPTAADRIEFGLKTMESFFPNARQYFQKGLSFSWHHQPYTRGGWPAYRPDQTDLIADLQRGEGRIVFAGDHTCLYTGWAQGALESAHFATAEVIAAARGSIEPTT
ncbi:flavin monoamine oxidase family protein [Sorangium sp. KYC3313]|uniref:flavin monoamine oxidase family protein n=2 Tax=Sorangium TaxID=39643 RepID=UPI003F88A27A